MTGESDRSGLAFAALSGPAEAPRSFALFDRLPEGTRAGIRTRLNLTYVAAMVAVNLLLFVALPLWLLPHSTWWALLLVAVMLTAPAHWALVHEAVHGLLLRDRAWNKRLGRALSVAFLCPFQVLRFGHLCHHALNGRPSDRPELYDPARKGWLWARVVFYYRLFFGLYLGELYCVLLCFLPRPLLRRVARSMAYEGNPDSLRMAEVAERQLTEPRPLAEMRSDAALILLLLAASLALYGAWWWLLVLALLGRGLPISFLDNAPHYAMPLGDLRQGHDLRLAQPLRWLLLNGNFHGTHHRHPTLPWTAWPARFAADGGRFQGSYFRTPLRQLRGPRPVPVLAAPVPARAAGEAARAQKP